MTPNTTNFDVSNIFPLISGLLVVLVIVWVVTIIASFFIYRSLKQVSNKSNTGLFGTAGLILLIGAIIPIIGLILMWISALILAIAFFTLKPQNNPWQPQLRRHHKQQSKDQISFFSFQKINNILEILRIRYGDFLRDFLKILENLVIGAVGVCYYCFMGNSSFE